MREDSKLTFFFSFYILTLFHGFKPPGLWRFVIAATEDASAPQSSSTSFRGSSRPDGTALGESWVLLRSRPAPGALRPVLLPQDRVRNAGPEAVLLPRALELDLSVPANGRLRKELTESSRGPQLFNAPIKTWPWKAAPDSCLCHLRTLSPGGPPHPLVGNLTFILVKRTHSPGP